MLAASRLGRTNRLGRPRRVVMGKIRLSRASLHAVSAIISPSTSSLGTRWARILRSLRIFAADGLSWLPLWEYDSSATLVFTLNSVSRLVVCIGDYVSCAA